MGKRKHSCAEGEFLKVRVTQEGTFKSSCEIRLKTSRHHRVFFSLRLFSEHLNWIFFFFFAVAESAAGCRDNPNWISNMSANDKTFSNWEGDAGCANKHHWNTGEDIKTDFDEVSVAHKNVLRWQICALHLRKYYFLNSKFKCVAATGTFLILCSR